MKEKTPRLNRDANGGSVQRLVRRLIACEPSQLADLQKTARKAWANRGHVDDPPTVEDLVECLTNVACNRLQRINELETHISKLCGLDKRW
jgi:hypothetical protein